MHTSLSPLNQVNLLICQLSFSKSSQLDVLEKDFKLFKSRFHAIHQCYPETGNTHLL